MHARFVMTTYSDDLFDYRPAPTSSKLALRITFPIVLAGVAAIAVMIWLVQRMGSP